MLASVHRNLCRTALRVFGAMLVLFTCFMTPASSSSDKLDFPLAHAETESNTPTLTTAIATWDNVELHDFVQHERPAIKRVLLPMLKALPSSGGHFSHTTVFYVLHRVLLKRHGWFLKGLEPQGKAWNSTSLEHVVILAKLPTDLQKLLQQQLHSPGLRANDIMTLVLITEHLVHQRTLGQLPTIYKTMGLNVSGSSPLGLVTDAVDTLFACFIAGFDSAKLNRVQLYTLRTRVHKVYPNWPHLRAFIHETMKYSLQSGSVAFTDAKRAVQEVAQRFGQWQDSECQDMKGALMKLEDRGTGRVRLADFYAKNIYGGKWQFRESIQYLRELGALDESNPNNPRVVIPNYVTGISNCIASSEYSAVCCLSECELIRERVEGILQSPEAEPGMITAIVATLPSASILANRTLSPVMLHRLNGIAMNHGGKVPLYGRLFAQWLHHAYPRECPFPHVSGSTAPKLQRDFEHAKKSAKASLEVMRAHARRSAPNGTAQAESSSPVENVAWTYEEELFVPPPMIAEQPTGFMEIHFAVIATFASIVAFGRALLRAGRAARQQVSMPCKTESKTVANAFSTQLV
mmetsp:Transcript_59891/g.115527  ORF Transcript_59891/g.115527 Transcript_59891/m.115527 type:complete len:576 (+) Transcript_59891:87-1814(+)